MGEIEFNEFNNTYSKYHNNDLSLICNNNILYYYGETKYILGFVSVVKGEQINLKNFPIRNIDPGIWNLPPHLLYFNLRESINLYKVDKNVILQKIYDFLSLANKNNLSEYDKTRLIHEIDFYLSLKQIEPTLRNELYDYFKCFNDVVIPTIIKTDQNKMSQGFKLIYEKIYSTVIENENLNKYLTDNNNNNNSNNDRGIQRIHNKSKIHFAEKTPFDDNNEYDFLKNTAAYINAVIIILLTVGILFGIMFMVLK